MKVLSLLEISIYVAAMIFFVLLLRFTCRNFFPKRYFVLLWTLVLLRFLIPLNLTLDIRNVTLQKAIWQTSVFRQLETPSPSDKITENNIFSSDHAADPENTDHVAALSPDSSPANAVRPLLALPSILVQKLTPVLIPIWLIVALLLALYYAGIYLFWTNRFRFSLPAEIPDFEQWTTFHRCSLHRKVRIRTSGDIVSPLSYGILRPVILLPKNMDHTDRKQLQMILEHEFIHLHYLDSVLKFAMVLTTCLYWYHPLIWVMDYYLQKDIEIACDEAVIRRLGMQQRKYYAMTLIQMEEQRNYYSSLVYNHFKKNATEERIYAMMRMKKIPPAAIAFSVFCLAGVTTVCATSANLIGAAESDKIRAAFSEHSFSLSSETGEEEFGLADLAWGCDLATVSTVFGLEKFHSLGIVESETGRMQSREYTDYLGVDAYLIPEITEEGLYSLEFLIDYAENPDLVIATMMECLEEKYGDADILTSDEVEAKAIWNNASTSLQLMYSDEGIRLILGKGTVISNINGCSFTAADFWNKDTGYQLADLPWGSSKEETETLLGIRFSQTPLLNNDQISIYQSLDLVSFCGYKAPFVAEYRDDQLYQINLGLKGLPAAESSSIYNDILEQMHILYGEESSSQELTGQSSVSHKWQDAASGTILALSTNGGNVSISLVKI